MARAANQATAKVEEFTAETQKTMAEGMEKMTKGFEDVSAFTQDNLDAVMKSSEIAAKAAEGIGTEAASYAKKSFEDGVAAAQDMAAAKNMTELFEKQTAFAQHAFEGFLAQTSKMNDITMSAVKDMVQPLNQRVSAAAQSMKSYGM